jgi:hypothetical protein
MLAENLPGPNSTPEHAAHASNKSGDRSDLNEQIQRLREENAALVSALCGLCIGLSGISEVHRAIIAQAFDYADGLASSGEFGVLEHSPDGGLRHHLIRQIRSLVLSRQSETSLRYLDRGRTL